MTDLGVTSLPPADTWTEGKGRLAHTEPVPLTVDQALELGDDLIRQLADHIGDLDALNAVFRRWVDVLSETNLACVCMAALQSTFAGCLVMTPLADVPDRSHIFQIEEQP